MTDVQALKWWQSDIIYQIYPRSFQDSGAQADRGGVGGDGVGDLPGVPRRLDYLASLGIGAIWFSPITVSPMKDYGYDVADYRDIDPLFGTLADFDELIARAHARGLKVMMDFVPNHSSDEHPWFVEARSSRDNPKRDWYIWRDPAPTPGGADGGVPNNWKSFFGGDAWTLDETTGQYYLHQFVAGQPELNWANPDVRREMADILRFWMRRGVDGFRVDVIWLLAKDPQLRDEPRNPDWRPGMPEHNSLLHPYTQDLPATHGYIRELRDALDEFEDRMMVGEIYLPVDRLMDYYGQPRAEGGQGLECHLPFNFQLILTPWEARGVRALVDEYDAAVTAAGGWPNWVLGNHDQPRFAGRVGAGQYRAAQTLLLTLRGTPTVYYGDEIGMRDVSIPPSRLRDPAALQQPGVPGVGRDPERTPMQWDASPNAGFTGTDAEPWLPLAPDAGTINVAAQERDPGSDLNYFRALSTLRRASEALTAGTYSSVEAGSPQVFAYLRETAAAPGETGGERVLVLLNFAGEEAALTLEGVSLEGAELLLSSRADARAGQLRGDEAQIWRLQ